MINRDKNSSLIVFLLGSILFLIVSCLLYMQVPSHKGHKDVDSKAYVENATCFARDGYFSESPRGVPYYTLGYPIFLGYVYRFFGGGSLAIVIVQALLTLLIGFLIARLASLLFSRNVGLISFILLVTNLGYLVFTQFILSEILLSLFLALFFERFYFFYRYNRIRDLLLSGLALGFSVTIKPAGLLFVFCSIALLFWVSREKNNFFKLALFFSLCFYMPIAAHMIHNKVMWNEFRLCALGSVNMHYWFFPNLLANVHGTNSDIERSSLHEIGRDKGDDAVRSMLLETVKKYPGTALKVWGVNMLKTFFGLFTTNLKVLVDEHTGGGCVSFFRTEGNIAQRVRGYVEMGTPLKWVHCVGYFEVIYLFFRYIFSLVGFFYLLKNRYYFLAIFIFLYVGYFVGVTGHDGCARFRMMVEFVFIILASLGVSNLFFKKNRTSTLE